MLDLGVVWLGVGLRSDLCVEAVGLVGWGVGFCLLETIPIHWISLVGPCHIALLAGGERELGRTRPVSQPRPLYSMSQFPHNIHLVQAILCSGSGLASLQALRRYLGYIAATTLKTGIIGNPSILRTSTFSLWEIVDVGRVTSNTSEEGVGIRCDFVCIAAFRGTSEGITCNP